nr:hypothetical protein SHINE37_30209 [Rhizobiaceae bacterium]
MSSSSWKPLSSGRPAAGAAGASFGSIAAARKADGRDGAGDDHEIAHQRPVADIMRVEGDARRIGHVVAPADLPETGEAGAGLEIVDGGGLVELQLVLDHRARPDEAHLAAQDVEELRQLVEAELAQHGADEGHPRIVLQLAGGAPLLIGGRIVLQILLQDGIAVFRHGAEFQAAEGRAVIADAAMAVEDAAAVGEFHQRHDHQEDGADDDDGAERHQDVEASFRYSPHRRRAGCKRTEIRRTGRSCRGLHRDGSTWICDRVGPLGRVPSSNADCVVTVCFLKCEAVDKDDALEFKKFFMC